jgi:hypothetical protein
MFAALLWSHILAAPARPASTQSSPDPEEYAVYGALLKDMFIGKETKRLIVEQDTAVGDYSDSDPASLLERLTPLTRETVEDFRARNAQPSELSDKFGLEVTINFISKDEIKKIFEKRDDKYDGWEAFRKKYPGAGSIITLSRVGFSQDKSQALIFVGYQCDWLCGQGNYILLTKKGGDWKVEKKSMTWIS